MTKYLAAIDLADPDSWEGILTRTVSMATGVEGTKVYVMTVLPGIAPGLDQRYAVRGEMQGSAEYPLDDWKADAEKKLSDVVKQYVPEELAAGIAVEHGTVYKEIVEAAKDLDIDQIVMGANRPSLADYLLGPNSARVARHAECSVTVVR